MSVMSTRIQEVYSLSGWYADVLRRYEQLAAWTSGSLATPHSVWLSGLFNPKAFLTAVRHTACSCCAGTFHCTWRLLPRSQQATCAGWQKCCGFLGIDGT